MVAGVLVNAPVALAQAQPQAPAETPSGADLSISPKRVVLGSADRAATLYIFNRGTQAATFGLSVGDRVMTPDGRIRNPEELAGAADAASALANLKSATAFVSFAPRRVTLQPGQSQTIRLRALRPADLAEGEYRTHLTITGVPPEDTGLTAEQAVAPTEGSLSVKIVTLFSVSLPVVVRQGKVEAAAAIEGARLESRDTPQGPRAEISLDLVRRGGASLYGDVEVRAMKGGKPGEVVGGMRGVGVYAETDRRHMAVPLSVQPAHGQAYQILFRDDDTQPGTALATTSFTAP